MVNVISPKVNVLGYIPQQVLERELKVDIKATDKGDLIIPGEFAKDNKIIIPEDNLLPYKVITPDEIIRGAGQITYKDADIFQEIIELKRTQSREEVVKSLIGSAGRGHASLSTSVYLCAFVGGDCSKNVDSVFSTAKYGSFIMPSSRRIPLTKAQILAPKTIHQNKEALARYVEVSEANIDAAEALQKRGVDLQESAKITQYGHRAGGFLVMPLETIAYFSDLFEHEKEATPDDAREIISQLEEFIHSNGMEVVYEGRKAAPRAFIPSPNIFHFEVNEAEEQIKLLEDKDTPIVLAQTNIPSPERDKRIQAYLERRAEVFSSQERIKHEWHSLLDELAKIPAHFGNTSEVKILSNTSWRVWGEEKRHRTEWQSVESAYHGVDGAVPLIQKWKKELTKAYEIPELVKDFSRVLSIPESVRRDNENLTLWLKRFTDSVRAYQELVSSGIPKRDAIMLIPRGIKLATLKAYGLYNLTTGKVSLRLCNTCEPEMLATTEAEVRAIQSQPEVPQTIKDLFGPKCHYTGFCPEAKPCEKILEVVPNYNSTFHSEMQRLQADKIRKLIGE